MQATSSGLSPVVQLYLALPSLQDSPAELAGKLRLQQFKSVRESWTGVGRKLSYKWMSNEASW
jgi:hypothetical protein